MLETKDYRKGRIMLKLSKFIEKIVYKDKIILIDKKNQKFIKIDDIEMINLITKLPCDISNYQENIDIKKLIENRVIVDFNVNEDDEIREFFYDKYIDNKDTLSLIILPTQNCNFKCEYCYEIHQNKSITKNDEIELIRAIKAYINEKKIKILNIEWFGGEPLMKFDLVCNVTNELKKFCEENNVDYYVSMTTNAYLLNVDKFKKLLELGCNTYQITIDGLKEIHDKTRKLKNGGKSWSKIINNLECIKEINENYNIKLRFNYCWELIDNIDEFFTFLKDKFLRDNRFTLYPAKMNDYEKDLPVTGIDTQYDYVTTNYLLEKMKEYEILPDHYIKSLLISSVCYGRMNNNFVIDYDLTLKKCTELLYDESNIVGKIENGKFNIIEEKLNKWIIPPHNIIEKYDCINCPDCSICLGGLCSKAWLNNQSITCTPFNSHKKKILGFYL